jgi:hypothetical protein
MNKVRALSILNLVALTLHIFLSYATQVRLVNTKDVGEISNQYASLFTPAGFTFAIWGLIYALLIVFCIYHIVMSFTKNLLHPANRDIQRIGSWFILNNLGAAAWLLVWTNNQISISAVIILFQLVSLIVIHLRLHIHDVREKAASKIFTQLPLSIYLGWITIATIANISIYLFSIQWDGFGLGYSAITWTRIIIAVAVVITMLVVLLRNNVAYGMVVIWALYGIISKLNSTGANTYSVLIQTAWIGIGVVGIICLVQLVKNISVSKFRHRFPEAIPVK